MSRRLGGALLLGLTMGAVGAVLEASWFTWLGVCLLLASAMAPLYARAAARGLRMDLEITATDPDGVRPRGYRGGVFEGEMLELMVSCFAGSPLRGPLRLRADIGGEVLRAGLPEPAAGGPPARVAMGPARRGEVVVTDVELRTIDPLGLCEVPAAQLAGSSVAAVYPRLISLRSMAGFSAADQTDEFEIRGIRPWREGDQRRQVHWKSTARQGQVMVKEHEIMRPRQLALYLEDRPSTRLVADQVARLAASEAFDCMSEGGSVALWWPGGPAFPAGTLPTLEHVLEVLARYPFDDRAGAPPPPATRAVAILETGVSAALAAAEALVAQGGRAGAWVVGDAELEASIPTRNVGTEWPPA